MRPKHRGVVRLKTQALWCRLDELNGSQNWLAEEIGISKSYMSFLISPNPPKDVLGDSP